MIFSTSFILGFYLWSATASAWSSQTYRSVPFDIPAFNVTKSGAALAPGYLFLTAFGTPDPASIIVTDEGELVWASAVGNYANLNVQTLNSKPVLTYWNGTGSPNPEIGGHGFGSVEILDSSYTTKHILCLDLGLSLDGSKRADCQADLHESYVTERGTLLVTAFNITQADLTPKGGPTNGWIYDCLFFEIDIQTQEIVFSWSALQNGIKISESKQPLGTSGTQAQPYDFFHINSIQSVGSSYLVNSRHTWTTYLLNSRGDVQWRLEGSTGGDFRLGPGIHFAWQHHARISKITPTGAVLSLFDNENSGPPFSGVNQTLGLLLSLDLGKKTATLIQDYLDPKQALFADSQGSFSLLPNGNVLQGYGQIPIVKEYGPRGDLRLSLQFGDLNGDQQSYRAYRLEWEGLPATDPAVFAETGYVYASWNGATGIQEWDIYEGTTAQNIKYTHSVKSTGFETKAAILSTTKYVKVTAVYRQGKRNSEVAAVSQSQ